MTEADRGAVVFDGRDITHAPPEEIAPMGIAQVPGGQGVFPSLTVAENLQAAGWMLRKDKKLRDERVGRGARPVPGPARSGPTTTPPTSPAASSRC